MLDHRISNKTGNLHKKIEHYSIQKINRLEFNYSH